MVERAEALMGKLTLIKEEAALADHLKSLEQSGSPKILAFANAQAFNLASRDAAFFEALSAADTLFRDGIGVKIACKFTKRDPGLNLNGTDLIPELIEAYRGKKIAVFGAEADWLDTAVSKLEAAGHRGIIACHGFQADEVYLDKARETQPDLIVLAMGMPRQERLAIQLRDALAQAGATGGLIVNGGAIVDFMAGKVPRAPEWVRKAGLEWAFRLGQEPQRLFKRYVVGNPIFLMRMLRLKRAGG